jgi:hypothetical protein
VCGRDDPGYRWRPDHGPDGLLIGGPRGEVNALVRVQGTTYLPVSASDPENERRQEMRRRARLNESRMADDPDFAESQFKRFAYVGKFTGPRKPLSSGRKRKAA